MEGATHAIPWIHKACKTLSFYYQPGLDKLQLIPCFYRYLSALNCFSLRPSFVHGTAILLWESAGTAVWCIKHSLWRVCIKFRKVLGFFSAQGKSGNRYDFAEISCSVVVLVPSLNKKITSRTIKCIFWSWTKKWDFYIKHESNPFCTCWLSAMYWYLSLVPCTVS